MTTIAFKDEVMAGDGRITSGSLIVDESNNKVFKNKYYLVGSAGAAASDHLLIKIMNEKMLSKDQCLEELFSLSKEFESSFLVYDISNKKLMDIESGGCYYPKYQKGYAIGSGAGFAMTAMGMGASAKQAVKEAIKYDKNSGGKIREVKV